MPKIEDCTILFDDGHTRIVEWPDGTRVIGATTEQGIGEMTNDHWNFNRFKDAHEMKFLADQYTVFQVRYKNEKST